MKGLAIMVMALSPDLDDNTPAWNAAVAAACAGVTVEERTIELGKGVYKFATKPNPISCDGVSISGTGTFTTTLRRMYSAPPADAFIELRGRGSHLKGFAIETAAGTSGGYGLFITTNNDLPPGGKHHLAHLRITGENHMGVWNIPLHIRGDLRTVDPIGVRGVKMYDVEVFDGTQTLAQFWGAIVCDWYGGGAYKGGGVASGVIVGGKNNTKNRIDADVNWATSSIAANSFRGPGR